MIIPQPDSQSPFSSLFPSCLFFLRSPSCLSFLLYLWYFAVFFWWADPAIMSSLGSHRVCDGGDRTICMRFHSHHTKFRSIDVHSLHTLCVLRHVIDSPSPPTGMFHSSKLFFLPVMQIQQQSSVSSEFGEFG